MPTYFFFFVLFSCPILNDRYTTVWSTSQGNEENSCPVIPLSGSWGAQIAILVLPVEIFRWSDQKWRIRWKTSYFIGYIDVVDGFLGPRRLIFGYIDVDDIFLFGYNVGRNIFGVIIVAIIR